MLKENCSFYSGDAKETLRHLVKEKQSFDLIFIDADKPSYTEYYKVTSFKEPRHEKTCPRWLSTR